MCQLSDFAGDPSGIWREKYDFTIEPNNVVQLMENINNTYRENNSYSKLWDIGVNWSSSYDQFRFYTPAVQTVYPYDDSVLNSAKMMIACCRLEYLNLIVHSRLTGRDDLTDDEFIQQTKKIVTDLPFDVPDYEGVNGVSEKNYNRSQEEKSRYKIINPQDLSLSELMKQDELFESPFEEDK
jgi:hypothetical protein